MLMWGDFPSGEVDKNSHDNGGSQVQFPVWEDLTCSGATKPLLHNCGARGLQLAEAHAACARGQERNRNGKLMSLNGGWTTLTAARERPRSATKTQHG